MHQRERVVSSGSLPKALSRSCGTPRQSPAETLTPRARQAQCGAVRVDNGVDRDLREIAGREKHPGTFEDGYPLSCLFSEADDMVYGPTSRARCSHAYSKAIDESLRISYSRTRGLECVVALVFNTEADVLQPCACSRQDPREQARKRYGSVPAGLPSVPLVNRSPEAGHVQGSCEQVVSIPALPGEVVEGVAHLVGGHVHCQRGLFH